MIEAQRFYLNRILLLAVGLWPYQQTKLVRLRCIFFLGILTTAVLFQLTTFITSECTSDLIVKVLSTTLFFTTFMINYISFAVNTEAVKDLLTQLQHICNEIKDKNENAILENYVYIAKCYTVGLALLAVCSVSIFILTQLWSGILNIILSTNISRMHLSIETEYFIDQEKYFSLILLHINAVVSIGAGAIVAVGSLLITYLQHTCGMFRIASYRIEQAMSVDILQNISLKNETLIFKGLICAVDIHRQAMKLSKHLLSRFEAMMFSMIAFGVITLSLNLFRVASSTDDVKEYLLPSIFTTSIILYMFLANYIGQDIMDHNNQVFATAYNVQWYAAPLHIQRLILFLLQRSAKNFTLNVGGLFVASMECFTTLVKTSVSYFTVIYSTR